MLINLLPIEIWAQPDSLTYNNKLDICGVIFSERSGKALFLADITLRDHTGVTIAQAQSGYDGEFYLISDSTITSKGGPFYLQVQLLGFESKKVSLKGYLIDGVDLIVYLSSSAEIICLNTHRFKYTFQSRSYNYTLKSAYTYLQPFFSGYTRSIYNSEDHKTTYRQ